MENKATLTSREVKSKAKTLLIKGKAYTWDNSTLAEKCMLFVLELHENGDIHIPNGTAGELKAEKIYKILSELEK